MSKKKSSNPYVTLREFSQAMGSLQSEIKTLKVVLVGEDMRGGLVKDVADIKHTLTTVSSMKNIIVPIIIAVASSVITAYLLGALP